MLLDKPIPHLREPHALVSLRPWVDVGSVGSLTLMRLEEGLDTQQLGRLAMPGRFFDFTRYRPTLYYEGSKRQVAIPNVSISYARRKEPPDFLFLRLLEPHMLGELLVESLLELLQRCGVKRYYLLGSMFDLVPHARPLPISGAANTKEGQRLLAKAGVRSSSYQGPTTILYMVSQRAPDLGIEAMSSIVHLPQYAQLEEDHIGKLRLLEILNHLYGLPIGPADLEQAESQIKQINQAVEADPQLQAVVKQIEANYDAEAAKKTEELPPLSPEIERFLGEIDQRFEDS